LLSSTFSLFNPSLISSHSTMKQFLPVEELDTRQVLRRLLAKPVHLYKYVCQYISISSPAADPQVRYNSTNSHMQSTAPTSTLQIFHGYEFMETNDPRVICPARNVICMHPFVSAPVPLAVSDKSISVFICIGGVQGHKRMR